MGVFEVRWQTVCVWDLLFSRRRWVFCVTNVTSLLWWWPICFGLLMPLMIGLMKSEFVLIDQLLLRGVRYGFLFEIDRTLIWWVVLPYTKCVCWEDTALKIVEKWFCFISFNALIYFDDLFFIYPWALWVDPLPTFIAAYPIDFILFSASCIPYYSRSSFWLIFVTYVAHTITVFRVTCIALPC